MTNVYDPWQILLLGLSWLYLVPELILLMVCWVNRRLSRWMWLVLAGFGLLLAAHAWSEAVSLAMSLYPGQAPAPRHHRLVSSSSVWPLFFVSRVAGPAGLLLVAWGLAMVFRDLRQRLESYRIAILRISGDKR